MQMHAEQHKRNNGDFFFFGKLINKYGSHETMLLGAKKKTQFRKTKYNP